MHLKVATFAKLQNTYIYRFISSSSLLLRDIFSNNYRDISTHNTQHIFLLLFLKVIWTDGVNSFTITLSFFNEVTLHNSLTPTLPSSRGFFFSQSCETQWKTHDHRSCLSLLALTDIIYTPAYWNYREKGRGKGRGFGLLLQLYVSVLLTGGWQDMMDLDGDTNLSVEACLLQLIQVLLLDWECVWEKETGGATEKVNHSKYSASQFKHCC